MLRRAVGAGAVALVMALMPLAATADVDLKSLLVDPPTSDWIEAEGTPATLDGPFTADSYAAFLQANGGSAANASSTKNALNAYRLTGGYARWWEQRGTQDLLIERVFEFADDAGANNWYSDIKLGAQTDTRFAGDIPGIPIPHSFGVVLKSKDGSGTQWRVDFAKANLVYVVHTDSISNDLANLAAGQATQMAGVYAGQSPTARPGSALNVGPRLPGRVITIAIVAVVGVLLLAGGAVAGGLALSGRRRPAAGKVQMSPDRNYWWDGLTWQPTATTTPAAAQRSPDGAYWWDGAYWHPVAKPSP